MLLSFSEPSMRPYVEAGIRQANGVVVGDLRVKRQTIRRRGSRGERLIELAKNACWTHPYDLHLWWKSRTKEREHLGTISGGSRIYPITILHSFVEPMNRPKYPVVRIDGPQGWRDGDAMLFWSPNYGGRSFTEEAIADGFNSAEAFRDYFVPNLGDRFDGVLFKW